MVCAVPWGTYKYEIIPLRNHTKTFKTLYFLPPETDAIIQTFPITLLLQGLGVLFLFIIIISGRHFMSITHSVSELDVT